MVKTAPLPDPQFAAPDDVEWRISDTPVDYDVAVAEMERKVADIAERDAREVVWLLEHPALYTAGTSADEKDLLSPDRFPVFKTGRGGQYTYHGPGQRVGYVMLDLRKRGQDVRKYVGDLERWLIATLAEFNVTGELREGRVGVWVRRPDKGPGREDKIAAIGVRIRKWVTFHGVSLNVDPVLDHFDGIVPCGISQHGVTSLADLGITATMEDVDVAMKKTFVEVFGE
ncbi:MAG: lipoyl(octanoyl) transferase LipB [Parvibaculum sp.]|uniref:lipoyl(octanoyl) transferase LipB n=1 Tax=Parvibaculum sp. TaxID=2024848 RepID=UPI0025CF4C0F|nr:lipoyl(octanoyl) transferase LipB [Parvibaculum sp.]MCE9648994.1 lipoyl(octanoyl) transferase LipB [Parvibaculum sp.]